jgi:pyruvate formate lyase activating enzyme
MQGIVFDIKRFAVHDGPGIRTTVFLKGCPLKCFWCHNPESIKMQPLQYVKKIRLDNKVFEKNEAVGISLTVEQIMETLRKDRIFMEESEGGVTFSGGEPTMQPEFLKSLLEECKKEGLHTAVDTCGYTSQKVLEDILPLTDLFLYDFKHYDSDQHLVATGKSNEIIFDNLYFLVDSGKKIQLRIPVIPDFNNSEFDIEALAAVLKPLHDKIIRVDLLPFHTIAKNKYKRFGLCNPMDGVSALQKEDLVVAKKCFEEVGFRVKIGG